MHTTLSSKLATLALALMMNGLMLGGIAFAFDLQQHQHPAASVLA